MVLLILWHHQMSPSEHLLLVLYIAEHQSCVYAEKRLCLHLSNCNCNCVLSWQFVWVGSCQQWRWSIQTAWSVTNCLPGFFLRDRYCSKTLKFSNIVKSSPKFQLAQKIKPDHSWTRPLLKPEISLTFLTINRLNNSSSCALLFILTTSSLYLGKKVLFLGIILKYTVKQQSFTLNTP